MKKIATLIVLLLCSFVHAQHKINAFVGTNYSYFSDGVAGQILAEQSFGLHIGGSYEIPLHDKIAFRPAIVFDQVGDRTQTKLNNQTNHLNQLDLKLSYINVPMHFKFWNKIYLLAGPQIGYLIQSKSDKGSEQIIDSKTDFGFNLGTGFTINRLFFEIGIYQGLTTLGRYNSVSTGNIKNVNNGYGQFTIGYRIQ